MFDYLLNKLSRYTSNKDVGKTVDNVDELDCKQIKFAKQFLNRHEVTDNKELRALLGVNPATTPWCAAFVNAVEKICGRKGTGKMLARSYLSYGAYTSSPRPGDIVVFKRGNSSWQGHVGYYISEDRYNILTLGGNQSNKVCYKYYPKETVLGYRRVL